MVHCRTIVDIDVSYIFIYSLIMSNIMTPKRNLDELTKYRHLECLIDICTLLTTLKTPLETALVLRDLLSPYEMTMLALRLRTARMLLAGKSYDEIQTALRISPSTIARISVWLEFSGDGYRLASSRLPKELSLRSEPSKQMQSDDRHSQYAWPIQLVSELLKTMDHVSAWKLLEVLAEAEIKSKLFSLIDRQGSPSRNPPDKVDYGPL